MYLILLLHKLNVLIRTNESFLTIFFFKKKHINPDILSIKKYKRASNI